MFSPLVCNDREAISRQTSGGITFFALLKKYRLKFSLAFICIVLANFSSLVFPWSMKLLLDEVLTQKRHSLLTPILGALALAVFLKAIFTHVGSCLSLEIGEKAVVDLRQQLYHHLLKLPVVDIENFSTGSLISRVIEDTESVKRFLLSGLADFLYSALNAFFVLGILFWMDAKAALFSAIFLPIFLIVYGGMGKKLKQGYEILRQQQSELSGHLGETFRGIRTIHAFVQTERETHKFLAKQRQILEAAFKSHTDDIWFFVTAEFFSSVGLVLLLGYGLNHILQEKMTLGTLMAFYTCLGFLFLPLLKMTAAGAVYHEAQASWQRIQDLLRREPGPKEFERPLIVQKIRGHIRFENVSFSYPDSRKALSGINFEVSLGESVAVIGASGSGKTTLVCLLARLFDPLSGRILVDGQDIRKFSLKDYRRQVLVVHQNDFLFSDTFKANIQYGNLETEDEAVFAAAEAANIHSFIQKLPQSYETAVGENGVKLSGGQRQRVAIARALLRDPAILVLDEALSAVDAENSQEITEAILKIRAGRTTIMITHRPSAIQNADKIIVLNEGKIKDQGKHRELKSYVV